MLNTCTTPEAKKDLIVLFKCMESITNKIEASVNGEMVTGTAKIQESGETPLVSDAIASTDMLNDSKVSTRVALVPAAQPLN